MYVCMYAAIHRPRAYHACAHAQILGGYTSKDRHNADASASDVVWVIVSMITCCSSGVVEVNALLSAHVMQEEKRRYGLSQS